MVSGTASFVQTARNLDDVITCEKRSESPFVVEKELVLSTTDYENFVSDLGVEREYLQIEHARCKTIKGTRHCLRVMSKKLQNGLLVQCTDTGYPEWIAISP